MVAPFGLSIAQQIAARFAAQPEVTAVALGGSRSTGAADPRADIDLYVYAAPPIAVATRAAIASAMAAPGPREIDNHFWEPGDEWALASADDTLRIDIMYRAPAWIEAELDRVLVRHEASLGYSTCLWHNVRHASVLYDRDGWFAQLQGIAAAPIPQSCAAPSSPRIAPSCAASIRRCCTSSNARSSAGTVSASSTGSPRSWRVTSTSSSRSTARPIRAKNASSRWRAVSARIYPPTSRPRSTRSSTHHRARLSSGSLSRCWMSWIRCCTPKGCARACLTEDVALD